MKKIPKYRSMNFPVYDEMLHNFSDEAAIKDYYQKGGLNGLEIILTGESSQGKIRSDMVNGVHLYFHIFWMDFWLGHYDRLDEEFDSRQQWIDWYGGIHRDSLLESYRKDLAFADKIGAKYVVFHVSEVTLRESFVYKYRYTDRQVIDAALEIINILLSEREYSFEFLVENLWWSGFTLKNPALTKRLIQGIKYDKKGIMFDLGHYMNTNSKLRKPEDAVAYIHRMLDLHEQYGFSLIPWMKGIHLQMSLGGAYKQKQKKSWKNPDHRINFEETSFLDLYTLAYFHANQIDLHEPFLGEDVPALIERLDPTYVTFELRQDNLDEYQKNIIAQAKCLGYI